MAIASLTALAAAAPLVVALPSAHAATTRPVSVAVTAISVVSGPQVPGGGYTVVLTCPRGLALDMKLTSAIPLRTSAGPARLLDRELWASGAAYQFQFTKILPKKVKIAATAAIVCSGRITVGTWSSRANVQTRHWGPAPRGSASQTLTTAVALANPNNPKSLLPVDLQVRGTHGTTRSSITIKQGALDRKGLDVIATAAKLTKDMPAGGRAATVSRFGITIGR